MSSTVPSTHPVPPGPPPRRGVVATARYFAGFALDPIGFVRGRFERYGDLYYAPGPDGGLYVARHPDHLREVLVTRASSYEKTHSAFQQLSRVLGDGLLTTDGDVWKRQRRMVQPAFTPARLAGYATAMVEETAKTCAALPPGEVVDVGKAMMELTLRIVSRTLFGHDVRGDTDDVARAMVVFQQQVSRPDLLPAWMPSPGRARFRDALSALDRIVYGMIEARRRSPDARADQGDLLSLLVAAVDEEGDGSRLSEKEVRDQLVTLFLAGHETTSHVLTWTLLLLAQTPDAQRALADETTGVLQGRLPTLADLPSMPYARCVLEEAMRLYPPVYGIARRAREDTAIGGYPIPAGSEVMLWVYLAHRDPRWFPEPDAFRPRRFLTEDASRPRQAYLPFGAGPRACIGKAFAMQEAQLILTTLASRFRFDAGKGPAVRAVPRITLCPSRPVRLRVSALSESYR